MIITLFCCLLLALALSVFVHQHLCKHQRRQLSRALPFYLSSLSCVRGQIAAVSHTQNLTQSPRLWPHPPSLLLLLPCFPSLHGKLSALNKGQLRPACPSDPGSLPSVQWSLPHTDNSSRHTSKVDKATKEAGLLSPLGICL